MVKCTNCKFFTGQAIAMNGHHHLICKAVEGNEFVPEAIALEDDLDCEFYVEDLDADN